MPSCYCESRRCNGRILPRQTITTHALEDKRAKISRAMVAYEAALEEQEAALTTQVAAVTISDDTSALSTGRLFTFPNEETLDPGASRAPESTRTINPMHDALIQIIAIEKDLKALTQTVEVLSATLSTPTKRTDQFPLQPSQASARELRNRLNRVIFSNSAVRQRKDAVSGLIKSLIRDLDTKKLSWDSQTDRIPEETAPYSTYTTGKLVLLLDFVKSNTQKMKNIFFNRFSKEWTQSFS